MANNVLIIDLRESGGGGQRGNGGPGTGGIPGSITGTAAQIAATAGAVTAGNVASRAIMGGGGVSAMSQAATAIQQYGGRSLSAAATAASQQAAQLATYAESAGFGSLAAGATELQRRVAAGTIRGAEARYAAYHTHAAGVAAQQMTGLAGPYNVSEEGVIGDSMRAAYGGGEQAQRAAMRGRVAADSWLRKYGHQVMQGDAEDAMEAVAFDTAEDWLYPKGQYAVRRGRARGGTGQRNWPTVSGTAAAGAVRQGTAFGAVRGATPAGIASKFAATSALPYATAIGGGATLAGVAGMAAAGVGIAGAAVYAAKKLYDFGDALATSATNDLRAVSPEIQQAEAEIQVMMLQNAMRRNDAMGEQLGQYAKDKAEFGMLWDEIKDTVVVPFMQMLSPLMRALAHYNSTADGKDVNVFLDDLARRSAELSRRAPHPAFVVAQPQPVRPIGAGA